MLVVLGFVPIVIVIAIVWPIAAIAKQQEASRCPRCDPECCGQRYR